MPRITMPRFYPQKVGLWFVYLGLIFFGSKLLLYTRTVDRSPVEQQEKGIDGAVERLNQLKQEVPETVERSMVPSNKRPIRNGANFLPPEWFDESLDRKTPDKDEKTVAGAQNEKTALTPSTTPKTKIISSGDNDTEKDKNDKRRRVKQDNDAHEINRLPSDDENKETVRRRKSVKEMTPELEELEERRERREKHAEILKKLVPKRISVDNSPIPPVTPLDGSQLNWLDRAPYPKLGDDGQMIPSRRIVHFDLKGAPPKVQYFLELFSVLRDLNATSILMEWEDMFPYLGTLASAKNTASYTKEEFEMIMKSAADNRLEVIPLVQTFGHLEWILKLPQFVHLRENPNIPQVICFGSEEGWSLIMELIDIVAKAHKPYGLPFFHIGADEAFELGLCEADRKLMAQQGGKQRLIVYHIVRVAKYLRENYNTRVLAWHDMFEHTSAEDLNRYKMTELVEPVVWSYAEDLDHYLPPYTWQKLSAFPYIWGASAFKGADGPSRFYSNPQHYITNHKAWVSVMRRNQEQFKQFRGIIMTGWSRYDHLAVLCEILPVGFPSLAYNLLELQADQSNYAKLQDKFGCRMNPQIPNLRNCKFPGAKIYEFVQQLKALKENVNLQLYRDDAYQGWMSKTAQRFNVSSLWYLNRMKGKINMYTSQFESIKIGLKRELDAYFYRDARNEFIFQYLEEDYQEIRKAKLAADAISARGIFPLRPYPELLTDDFPP